MKNLFFALAFMLVGTFAFANNEKAVINNTTIDCVSFTLSCGVSGSACGYTSIRDLVSDLMFIDDLIC